MSSAVLVQKTWGSVCSGGAVSPRSSDSLSTCKSDCYSFRSTRSLPVAPSGRGLRRSARATQLALSSLLRHHDDRRTATRGQLYFRAGSDPPELRRCRDDTASALRSSRPSLPIPTSCASTHRKSAFEHRSPPSGRASENAEQACISLRSTALGRSHCQFCARWCAEKESGVHLNPILGCTACRTPPARCPGPYRNCPGAAHCAPTHRLGRGSPDRDLSFLRTYPAIAREQFGTLGQIRASERGRVRSCPFQKASENRLPEPNQINARVGRIRPFHKVWVEKQPYISEPR